MSHFHIGYLEAVLGTEPLRESPGSNISRRSWSLTGYLMGLMRIEDVATVVDFIKEHKKQWNELFDEGSQSARAMLLPHLLIRFAESTEWRLLIGMLDRTPMPVDGNRALGICNTVYEFAANLVRRGKTAEAIPLLKSLINHAGNFSTVLGEGGTEFNSMCLRKLGQAHLRAGRFGKAKKVFGKVLSMPEFHETANTCTDLGLAESGYRSLDFLLPMDNQKANETTVTALERHVGVFEKALNKRGRNTNAQFILGLIDYYRDRPLEAELHFSAALAGMLEKEDAYQVSQLIDWTRLLLAIQISEQCEPARLNEVKGLIEIAMKSEASFPLSLWERLCRALSLYDDKTLAEYVVQHLLKVRGESAYSFLQRSGLLTLNAAIRGKYRKWLDSQRLSPKFRAEALVPLLNAVFGEIPENKDTVTEAAEILDTLEGIAKSDSDFIPEFLELTKTNRTGILSIWNEDDIDTVEAGLWERIGSFEQSGDILRRLFYRRRSDEDWVALENIVSQIEQFKLPSLDVESLKAQIEHLRPALPPVDDTRLSLDGIKVLYVGGNEIQMRYEESIQSALNRRHPGISTKFYFPGWDSNWNVHLEKVAALLPRFDVVVINSFVRTQFGRNLRANCNKGTPWRACTGQGRKSLQHAIETAAKWIALSRFSKAKGS